VVCNVSVARVTDGRFLAFDLPGAETRARDIFVVPTAGGPVTPVVEYAGDDALVGWRRDGGSVVFKSARAGSAGLWSVPFAQEGPDARPT
jgi:Tol biopolymer transport system component